MRFGALQKVIDILNKLSEEESLTDGEAFQLQIAMYEAGHGLEVSYKKRQGKRSFTCRWKLGKHEFDGFRGSDLKDVLRATASKAQNYVEKKLEDHESKKKKKKKK